MIFRIAKRDHPFAQIDKRILSDPRLSLGATGLLAYLLSKPDDWTVRKQDLVHRARGNYRLIERTVKELAAFGYLRLKPSRGANGKFAGSYYEVHERPSTEIVKNRDSVQRALGTAESRVLIPHSDNDTGSDNGTGTKPLINGQLPVQAPQAQPVTGNRPATAGLEEQIERLERIAGPKYKYLGWWRKHAGKSPQHLKAFRQTLDDYATNRNPIHSPTRWITKTFKQKVRALVLEI